MPGLPFSGWELILILGIALVVLGPGKLPDLGAAMGRTIREFRKAASDAQEAVSLEAREPSPGTPAAVRPVGGPPAEAATVTTAPAAPSEPVDPIGPAGISRPSTPDPRGDAETSSTGTRTHVGG
jgi:TatA/E family protein of Tat protein translocase